MTTEPETIELLDGVGNTVATYTGFTVHQRMLAVLAELPAIGKTEFNQQQKFHFRGHDAVMNALNPLLAKHGVLVIPDVLDRVVAQRTTSKGSIMYEVNLHVRYRFYGADGDMIEASTWGEGTDMGDKATNKAMTMAFKNVLNQAFAISNEEFSDSDSGTPEETYSRVGAAPGTAADAAAPSLHPAFTDAAGIAEALNHLDPSVDWRSTWLTVERAVYGDKPGKEAKRQSVASMSHVAAALTDGPDFPPPTDEDIQVAFADAFGGISPATIIRHEPAEPAPVTGDIQPDDQIPFGE